MDFGIIVQVFNIPWKEIVDLLPIYKSLGVNYLQVSPVQPHCTHIKKWYRMYQPYSFEIGNSLGSSREFYDLVKAGEKYDISIIVDVVLHHSTGCPYCNPGWDTVRWWREHKTKISKPSGPPISVELQRFQTHDWGPKQDLFDAKDVVIEFIRKLIGEYGVGGFRIDAAKHIFPELIHYIFKQAFFEENNTGNHRELLIYSEVMDSGQVLNEYLDPTFPRLMVINFPETWELTKTFGWGGNLLSFHENYSPHKNAKLYFNSIHMTDCHDSILGDSYKFGCEQDSRLALCYLLATGAPQILIYYTFLAEEIIQSALLFYNSFVSMNQESKVNRYRCNVLYSCSDNDVLVGERSDYGIFFLNKSGNWRNKKSNENEIIFDSVMKNGIYNEIRYNFQIKIENSRIKCWDMKEEYYNERTVLNIGPRDCLFFIHDSVKIEKLL